MWKSCYYLFLLPVLLFGCSLEEASTKKVAKGGKVYGGTIVYESPEIVDQYFPLSCLSMYEQRPYLLYTKRSLNMTKKVKNSLVT